MNIIEHVHEPRRLLLIWQEPEGAVRTRRAVAELLRGGGDRVRFQYLTGTPEFDAAKKEGFINFPAFRKLDASYDLGVVETFMRRLPPRSRGDYAQYLEQFRLHPETPISEFALLGYTGAKLPSDGFSILNPLEDVGTSCELLIEVAGFRHVSRLPVGAVQPGQSTRFAPQTDNPEDPMAVAIELEGERIGYVPRQQAPAIRTFVQDNAIKAHVERINGKPERPVIYLMTKVRKKVSTFGSSTNLG